MIKQLKQFSVRLIAGANVATVAVMLLVGYSDRLDPTDHPMLSTVGMTFPFFLLINMLFLFFWLMFKWRMLWIPVGGFLLAYVPITIYLPLNPRQQLPDQTLKVISYNVCTYGGNFKYDNGFAKVLDYFRQEAPDIICVQEDVDTWRRYCFQEYEKNWTYNDTLVLVKKKNCFNALGIHTRYPILKRERINYASQSNGSVAWWLNVDGDTVVVVNNHFESCHLTKDDRQQYRQILRGEISADSARTESKLLLVKLAEANAKRSRQIRAVCSYVEAHNKYPIIVCGDFNDNPISYSRREMALRLTDCFTTSGRGIGLSYNQKAFSFRIDHLFCSSHFEPINCVIDDDMDASDHNPLVCWLKIRQKSQKKNEKSE